MNGGYILVDVTGLNLSSDASQEIDGIWDKAVTALKVGKPIVVHGCTYGTAPVSPVTCFGWYIGADEIVVVVGATLHVHIKNDDTAVVLDAAAS
jgi:hypothetical protein